MPEKISTKIGSTEQHQAEWDRVLSAAARLQKILPNAVLVGGTATAIYAEHRFSRDADHVLTALRDRFDEVLSDLESVAGWKTSRVQRPVQILGSLDGIDTGVRQLIRSEPLEITSINCGGIQITLPTPYELLRIKGILILKRNATRDYLDFAALAHSLGDAHVADALIPFDRLYPQDNGESALQQLTLQLAHALPFDLDSTADGDLSQYRQLDPRWHQWQAVQDYCAQVSVTLFDQICTQEESATRSGASLKAEQLKKSVHKAEPEIETPRAPDKDSIP